MSMRVLFNGAVLSRPGAATKLDASQFQNIALSGIGTVGLIGEADGGQPRTVQVFASPGAVKSFYRSGDLVEAAAMVANPGNDPRIPGGAQQIVCYKVNGSTQASLVHSTVFTYTSKQYGLLANNISVGVAAGTGTTRIITITDYDDHGNLIQEVSPELGGTGKFTIQYVGAGTVATMTITATALTTTITGGPGGENLNIQFADWANLFDIINYINGLPGYTCASLITNAVAFDPTYLDALTTVDIKTSLYTVYAKNFDLYDWVNTNSQIITATVVKGQTGPVATLTTTALSGGTRGTSANTDWTDGLTLLRTVRINQLVPLASADATASQGTFTIASILAAITAHCKLVSSTAGRNECEGWIGFSGNRAALITNANTQNSEHVVMVGQKPKLPRTLDGVVTTFGEWAYACLLAGMRAGAPLGEPLTWKYVNVQGQTQDASWDPSVDDDVQQLTLNGVTVVCEVKSKGFRIDKCVTTFTKLDNDAYTEETIVQIWKAVCYELRRNLEDTYVGRPGSLPIAQTVPATVTKVMEAFRDAGAITDSIVNGKTIRAYRDITVSLSGDKLYVGVTVSPTPGINFVLNTIVLVPAQISLAA